MTVARTDGFDELLERLAARHPDKVEWEAHDVPRLKEADIAACLDAMPHLTDDFLACNGSLSADMAACLRHEGALSVGEYLAASFLVYITRECKRAIAETLTDRDTTDEGSGVDRAYMDYIGSQL